MTFERHLVEQLAREQWLRHGHEPFARALADLRRARRQRALAPLSRVAGALARHRPRLQRPAPTAHPARTAH